jgi:hypothetical protein
MLRDNFLKFKYRSWNEHCTYMAWMVRQTRSVFDLIGNLKNTPQESTNNPHQQKTNLFMKEAS